MELPTFYDIPVRYLVRLLCEKCYPKLAMALSFRQPIHICPECLAKVEEWKKDHPKEEV